KRWCSSCFSFVLMVYICHIYGRLSMAFLDDCVAIVRVELLHVRAELVCASFAEGVDAVDRHNRLLALLADLDDLVDAVVAAVVDGAEDVFSSVHFVSPSC